MPRQAPQKSLRQTVGNRPWIGLRGRGQQTRVNIAFRIGGSTVGCTGKQQYVDLIQSFGRDGRLQGVLPRQQIGTKYRGRRHGRP